jgi:hypothetical protein
MFNPLHVISAAIASAAIEKIDEIPFRVLGSAANKPDTNRMVRVPERIMVAYLGGRRRDPRVKYMTVVNRSRVYPYGSTRQGFIRDVKVAA